MIQLLQELKQVHFFLVLLKDLKLVQVFEESPGQSGEQYARFLIENYHKDEKYSPFFKSLKTIIEKDIHAIMLPVSNLLAL